MTIKIYNTMSRKLEEFKSLIPNYVGIYSCGPTVYHFAHIGNLRTYIHADILKRMFIQNGYSVKHIINITDVGHLTSDSDSGDDKMEKGAARENASVWDIAKMYTDAFINDISDLNILPASQMPRATDYISQQIDQVAALEKLGYTYEIADDGIYYDTSKFSDYGELGGQNLAQLKAGARIEENAEKRNMTDFALWKFSPKNTKRAMEWDSPWGVGFPGWHIECSAMSSALLGPHFDIHTGGIDHIKIHHTNEIAQSQPLVGKPWVNYWMHFEFLIDNSGKMSKSSGEFLTLSVLKARGFDPMFYRYLIMLGHYNSQIEFSFDAMESAGRGYKNIVKKLSEIIESCDAVAEKVESDKYDLWHNKMMSAISDNLKTATVLVYVQDLLKDTTANSNTKLKLFDFIDSLLGLRFIASAKKLLDAASAPIPVEIMQMVDARTVAKSEKNWADADALRKKIESAGWTLLDTNDGVKITKSA